MRASDHLVQPPQGLTLSAMALLRIMSWTSPPYLPMQSLLGATLTATERARLRPCRTIQSMPDTSAGWKDTGRSTCTVYHPRSQPPPPETCVSSQSLVGAPVLHTDFPAPSGPREGIPHRPLPITAASSEQRRSGLQDSRKLCFVLTFPRRGWSSCQKTL